MAKNCLHTDNWEQLLKMINSRHAYYVAHAEINGKLFPAYKAESLVADPNAPLVAYTREI